MVIPFPKGGKRISESVLRNLRPSYQHVVSVFIRVGVVVCRLQPPRCVPMLWILESFSKTSNTEEAGDSPSLKRVLAASNTRSDFSECPKIACAAWPWMRMTAKLPRFAHLQLRSSSKRRVPFHTVISHMAEGCATLAACERRGIVSPRIGFDPRYSPKRKEAGVLRLISVHPRKECQEDPLRAIDGFPVRKSVRMRGTPTGILSRTSS